MFQPSGHFPTRPDGAAHVDTQTNINGAGPGNGQLSPLVPQSQDGSFSREMDFTMMMNQQPGVGTADTPAASLRRLSLSGSSRFDHGPNSPHLMGSALALFGDSRPRQQSYMDSSPSPSLGFSEPTSRSQSVALMNRMLPLDYGRGYSHHMPHPNPGAAYHNGAMQNDMSVAQSIQGTLHLLLEEVQKMNHRVSNVESTNQNILSNQQLLTDRLEATEAAVHQMQETLVALPEKTQNKAASSKNISNQHPKLKNIIHPLFFNLCGISKSVDQAERMVLLASLAPLPNNEAYMTIEGKEVWRPRWNENVISKVNDLYISEIINRVWTNETALRNSEKGKPEMEDDDYDIKVIRTMVKGYFRNLADQLKKHTNPEKLTKHAKKQIISRCRARRVAVATRRREAVATFEEIYKVEGAAALVDTDFGSIL
ncbi:hypothetical protein PAXINDRAFT_12306 [Paxillus involutus ATCC 200175]|uniref:Uncharacterized protein n=1 Tax=Paxillus involutus ATCC 200175 TaxID=664439 RepID=A0A0C9U7C8_PAXIN|nr:hypothetical protein PAXINDRAFT_12306 [Paxillus involutus ATCC 200175]